MIKFLCVRASVFACSCQIKGNGKRHCEKRLFFAFAERYETRSRRGTSSGQQHSQAHMTSRQLPQLFSVLCLSQNVSPATLSPTQGILDCAYINTKCLTNRSCSFNWITRSAPFPLVRLGGSGTTADSPSLPR